MSNTAYLVGRQVSALTLKDEKEPEVWNLTFWLVIVVILLILSRTENLLSED